MHTISTQKFLILIVGATTALAQGCRPPEDDFWNPDANVFDASIDDDAGPGAACPDDAPDPFNNTYSPYMGGEESVDLEVIDFSYFA